VCGIFSHHTVLKKWAYFGTVYSGKKYVNENAFLNYSVIVLLVKVVLKIHRFLI
jgi:hypothetical protein